MEIHYLGHSCFRLRTRQASVLTDPFDPGMVGLPLKSQTADIVTISHSHQDHSYLKAVKGKNQAEPFVIQGPGEYEVKQTFIIGWQTYHDAEQGKLRGKNTIYRIELEDISVLHLGDLGHELSADLVSELGEIDVLLIPVGGVYTIDASQAAQIVRQIEPKIVIPMHFYLPQLNPEHFAQLQPAEEFFQQLGLSLPEPETSFKLAKSQIGDEMQVKYLLPLGL